MKKWISILLTIVMLMSTATISFAATNYGEEWEGYYQVAPTTFSDVPSKHWAYNAVMQVCQKNWFNGYPDGTFRPNASITRAEALKVFVVFLGLDYQSVDLSELTYSDISARDWYAPYVEAGKDLFPVHTTIQGKTPFNPNMPVTREDTIYALVKALGCDVDVKYPDQSVLNMFRDANSISGNCKSIFSIALMHELVSGFPDGTIRAQAALTRAEFATLLLRGTEHGFHDRYVAKIESVKVTPTTSTEMTIGETITLSARATYTDGSNKAYTELSPYDANGNGVIALKGTTITAVKEGTAVIKYNDSYLKNEALTITVKKPTDAPVIKVTGYDEITKEETMVVSGTVTDKNGSVDLTCNGKDIAVKSDGSFKTTVNLKVGKNEIKFVAINTYGLETTKTIAIEREEVEEEKPTEAPVIKVTGYDDVTKAETMVVSGTATDKSGSFDLTCNGKDIAVGSDGSFKTTVNLKVGKNEIKFVAINTYGLETTKTIVIKREEVEEEKPVIPEKDETEEVVIDVSKEEVECKFFNMKTVLDTSWGDDELFFYFSFLCNVDVVQYGIEIWDAETGKEIDYCDAEKIRKDIPANTEARYGGCHGSIFDGKSYNLVLGRTYRWIGYAIDADGNRYESKTQEFLFDGAGSRFLG